MGAEQKESVGREQIKLKPESERKQKEKGRFRKWLNANRLPLLEVALIATVAGAFFYKYPPPGDRFVQLYEKGMIEFKELPLNDKFNVWRKQLIRGKCGISHDAVIIQAQEEYFRLLEVGKDDQAKEVQSEIEFYINDHKLLKEQGKCDEKKENSPSFDME